MTPETAAAPAKDNTGTETQKPAATTPGGDTKPAEQKPAETTTEKPGGESTEKPASKDGQVTPESKAPEKYALTLPDGGRLDATDLETIETIARAEGWSNEEAQQRVTEHAKQVDAQSARFETETKADPVYGGRNFADTQKYAGAALDHFRRVGTPRGDAYRRLMDKSGYGNHLEVLSVWADIGKAMAEDTSIAGGGALKGAKRSDADVLFGDAVATKEGTT